MSGSLAASNSFALAPGNTNPPGIAYPPMPGYDRHDRQVGSSVVATASEGHRTPTTDSIDRAISQWFGKIPHSPSADSPNVRRSQRQALPAEYLPVDRPFDSPASPQKRLLTSGNANLGTASRLVGSVDEVDHVLAAGDLEKLVGLEKDA